VRAPAAGTTVDGRYVVVSFLGEGATGVVVHARPVEGGPDVALKILDPELFEDEAARRRFAREARALAEISHPNVISVRDTGIADGRAYIATELCHGETLDRALRRGAPSPEVAIDLSTQLLAGLSFVHQHGVFHRDLKPHNVYLAKRPDGSTQLKLLDFGLAKFGERNAWGPSSVLTVAGTMLGTPGYMAPEQAFGGTVDARADVYAAGAVAFEIFAGKPVFEGDDPPTLLRAHALDPVPPLASVRPRLAVRPELDAWLRRALEKTPPGRFPDAITMRIALAGIPKPIAWLAPT
jgi:eukaryotic-like serine/threonine-protein kinase